MTKQEFQERIRTLLNEAHDRGIGPRAVVRVVGDALVDFIFSEAGCFAPDAIEELSGAMRARVEAVIAAEMDGEKPPRNVEEAKAMLVAMGFQPF